MMSTLYKFKDLENATITELRKLELQLKSEVKEKGGERLSHRSEGEDYYDDIVKEVNESEESYGGEKNRIKEMITKKSKES